MGLRDTFLNMLGGESQEFQKTDNSVLRGARDFLKYGNRDKLYPSWSDIKMPDSDMYRGYSYAVIQKRGNKVASLAKNNLKTWANPEIVDEYQKKDEDVLHPYLKLIEDSTKFTEKQFWKNISIYLDLAGRYYLGVIRTSIQPKNPNLPIITTDPTEFVMLNPYEIRRVIDKNKNVAGYIERKKDGRYREWPLHQIIEMRELNPFDPENSQWAMTDAAKEAVYTINQSGDYTRQSLNGNIDAPGIITTDVLLNDEDFANFRARVTQHTKGEPIFGNGTGAIKWEAMQIDLDKAALLDINEINRTTLFAVSGTSKTSLGIEQSGTTRETANVQRDQFISDTAQPRLEDIVDFLNLDYKKYYGREYKQTGYKIEVESAVGRDYDTEQKATALKQAQFQLAMTLIQAGYTEQSAYQFAEDKIDFEDLELEKGVDKPKNPEEPDQPEDSNENSPTSPNNGPQSDSGSGKDNSSVQENKSDSGVNNDLNELEPHSDLVENSEGENSHPLDKEENGGKGSGNFGHAGREGEVGGSAKTKTSSKNNLLEESEKLLVNDMGSPYDSQGQLQNVAEVNGFNKTPEQVSKEDYDKVIEDGGIEVFRGIHSDSVASSDEYVEDFVDGDYYVGNGYDGVGIYTTDSLSDADYYATVAGDMVSTKGKILKMVLPKGTNIVNSNDIYDEYREFQSAKIKEYSQKSEEAYRKNDDTTGDKYDSLVIAYDRLDLTTYAAMKGYDVVKTNSSAFGKENVGIYVVLNRGKVKVEKSEPTIKWQDDKRVNSVNEEKNNECTCNHDHKVETFINEVQEDEGKVVEAEYNDFLEEIRLIEKETINACARKIDINAFDESDIIGKRKKKSLIEKLKNSIQSYWWVLFPLFANNSMSKRNKEFDKDVKFTFNNELQKDVIANAERVAEGHMETILNDVLEASNKAYTNVLEDAAAELIIKAYKVDPTKYEQYFKTEPTMADALESIRNTDILEENRKIYEKANKMAFEGYNRGDIVKAIRAEYKDISEKRATLIARNETSRAFTHSQFESDRQFLNSIGKINQAYKQWYSRRPANEQDKICAFCQAMIDKGPIPFEEPFIEYGNSIEVQDGDKVKIFTANYENIEGGCLHPNCQCAYKLVFKNDAGEFVKTLNMGEKDNDDRTSNNLDSSSNNGGVNDDSCNEQTKTLNGGKGSGNFGHSGRLGEVGGSGKKFTQAEIKAIKGYSAAGGGLSSEYPYSKEDVEILENLANNSSETSPELWRKVSVSEAEKTKTFEEWYGEDKEIEVNFDRFQSFTEDRVRAHTFGGSETETILYRIPKGEKILGVNISGQSVYSEEKEHLVGSANKFKVASMEIDGSTSALIITLTQREDINKEKYNDQASKNLNGGPGSGNFGHSGRAGEIGGSSKESSEPILDKILYEDENTAEEYKKECSKEFQESLLREYNRAKAEGLDVDNLIFRSSNKVLTGNGAKAHMVRQATDGRIKLAIAFEKDFLNTSNVFKQSREEKYKDKFFTTKTVQGAIRHEFGHLRMYQAMLRGNLGNSDESADIYARQLIKKATGKDFPNRGYLKSEMSGRGSQKAVEAVAESWANPNYSNITNKIAKLLKETKI